MQTMELQGQIAEVDQMAYSREAAEFLLAIEAGETDGVSCWRSPAVERRDGSTIEGQGLFALENIEPNTLIAIKQGRVVGINYVKENLAMLRGSHQQLDWNHFLAGETPEEVDKNLVGFNHSCDPNARVLLIKDVPLAFLIARKAIQSGDEITVDYAASQATTTHIFRGSPCQCGSGHCRGVILPAWDWKLPELQERYAGEFAWYIQDEIDRRSQLPESSLEGVEKFDNVFRILCTVDLLEERREKLLALRDNPELPFLQRAFVRWYFQRQLGPELAELEERMVELATIFCTANHPFADLDEYVDKSSLHGKYIGKDITRDAALDVVRPQVKANFSSVIDCMVRWNKSLSS